MESRISIQNLKFFYDDSEKIHNLSLEIPKNQIMSIIGPARSGITTLLRALNRMCDIIPEARVEGKILLDGKNIFDKDVKVTELRRKVGMVYDIPAPLPMSIFDNIAYGPRLSGIKNKAKLNEIVEEALTRAALWDEVKNRLRLSGTALSGGQQQRLCLARALALEPEVILLDRPCSGLDPISTALIEESLTKLKEKYTIVIAPHSVQQAERISDRTAFLLIGHLIEEGPTDQIFHNATDQRTTDYISGKFG